MGHVDKEQRADFISDLAESLEIDLAGIGGAAGDDHLWTVSLGEAFDFNEIDAVVFAAHAVLDSVEPFARLVRLGAVGQVATGIKAHAENGVAWLEDSVEDALVRLAARVWLDVGEFTSEKRLGTINCQVLGDIDKFATAIVALARIAFGILVREYRALRFKHSF